MSDPKELNDAEALERQHFNEWAKTAGFGQSQAKTWAWDAWKARASLAGAEPGAPTHIRLMALSLRRQFTEEAWPREAIDLDALGAVVRWVLREPAFPQEDQC